MSAPETSASVPVSAIRGEGDDDRVEVVAVRWPGGDLERRLAPRQGGEARVGAHPHRRRAIGVAQEARDFGRRVGERGDLGDGRLRPLRLRLEGRDAPVGVALAALRHDARRRLRDPPLDLERGAALRRPVTPSERRILAKTAVARVHFDRPAPGAPLALEGRALGRGEVAIFRPAAGQRQRLEASLAAPGEVERARA